MRRILLIPILLLLSQGVALGQSPPPRQSFQGSTAAESGHKLCAGACALGTLLVNTTTAGGWVLLYNATSDPGNGTVAPVLAMQIAANSTGTLNLAAIPAGFSTGAFVVFSTTGPFTETASATATFFWQAQ